MPLLPEQLFNGRHIGFTREKNRVDVACEQCVSCLFRRQFLERLNYDAIGQAMARGPFAYPYVAGFLTGSPYYDAESSDFQAYDTAKAGADLPAIGLEQREAATGTKQPNES